MTRPTAAWLTFTAISIVTAVATGIVAAAIFPNIERDGDS